MKPKIHGGLAGPMGRKPYSQLLDCKYKASGLEVYTFRKHVFQILRFFALSFMVPILQIMKTTTFLNCVGFWLWASGLDVYSGGKLNVRLNT